MSDSIDQFVTLSVTLTGYDRAELFGTGMVEAFYGEMTTILGGRIVGELLSTWTRVRDLRGLP